MKQEKTITIENLTRMYGNHVDVNDIHFINKARRVNGGVRKRLKNN